MTFFILNANILKFMKKIHLFIVLILVFVSCNKEKKTTIDVSKIQVAFSVDRFDVDFYTSTKNTLQKTKEKYPLLFPAQTPDSIWLAKINDKDEQELFAETQKIFSNFDDEKQELTTLFKHIKYYYPKFTSPKIITMLTNIDYENRVVLADSLLLISLDAYLGKNHPFYGDYPKYIKENNHKKHIIVDVAKSYISKQFPPNLDRTFLGKLIYEGKKMYFLDAYLPFVSDKEKSGYSVEKLAWATLNEEQVWKYFIDKKLLYDTDTKLNARFLDVAPFSKFYLSEDNKSPGQIGVFIGWQIVRSFMRENDVSLQELITIKASDLFKKSGYKPKK